MSTRSLHNFYNDIESFEEGKPVATIYRHWDGYPSGAGVDILNFIEACKELPDSRSHDASYYSAKYVVFLSVLFGSSEHYSDNPLDFLSVGIQQPEKLESSWCEYQYDFIVSGNPTVYVTGYDLDKVKCSDLEKIGALS